MTRTPLFRDWELAEQREAAKQRRQRRRAAYYTAPIPSGVPHIEQQISAAHNDDPADRAFRIANQMLSGKGQ